MYAAALYVWAFFWRGTPQLLGSVLVILIDKNNPSNVLRRGNYWRGTLKTSTIWALDAEDFVWNSILLYSYNWIFADCKKNLIYGKGSWYRYLGLINIASLSLLLFSSLLILLSLSLNRFIYQYDYISVLSLLLVSS